MGSRSAWLRDFGKRSQKARLVRAVCTCVHGCMYARVRLPACLLQGQERPLGEEVQSVTNQVIFITAVRLGEEGGRGQRSRHSSSLSKLGVAQPEAGSLELEPDPGARLPTGTPAPIRSPTSCLQSCLPDQVKGGSPTLPCLLLPPSCICLGGSAEGWMGRAQAPPSLEESPETDRKGKGKEKGRRASCPQPAQTQWR